MRTVLSLFSGIGLGDLGCEVAGCETVGQVEIDEWNRTVLEHHWPGLWRRGDITEVTDAEFARFSGVWCVAGGFPCQDISVAGKGAGIDGERSGLWTHMRLAISVCRPAWALIENVPALRTRGADRVLADMAELGYACTPLVVGAWAVGAPHRRERVWIVCRRVSDSDNTTTSAEQLPERSEQEASEFGAAGGLADAQPTRLEGQRPDAGQPTHPESGHGCMGDTGSGGREAPEHPEHRSVSSCTREAVEHSRSGVSGFWPTGPGQPQHEWEEPRIAQSRVGGPADDRKKRGAMARWRKASLKGLGNAQVPLVVAAVVRAMIRTETAE